MVQTIFEDKDFTKGIKGPHPFFYHDLITSLGPINLKREKDSFTKTLPTNDLITTKSGLTANLKTVDALESNDKAFDVNGNKNDLSKFSITKEKVIRITYKCHQSKSFYTIHVGLSHDIFLNFPIKRKPFNIINESNSICTVQFLLPCANLLNVDKSQFIAYLNYFNCSLNECNNCVSEFHLMDIKCPINILQNDNEFFKKIPGFRVIMNAKKFFELCSFNPVLVGMFSIEKGFFEKNAECDPITFAPLIGEFIGDGSIHSQRTILKSTSSIFNYRNKILNQLNQDIEEENNRLQESTFYLINESNIMQYGKLKHSIATFFKRQLTNKTVSSFLHIQTGNPDDIFEDTIITPEQLLQIPENVKVKDINDCIICPLFLYGFVSSNERNYIKDILSQFHLDKTKIFGVPVAAFEWSTPDIEWLIGSLIATDGNKKSSQNTNYRLSQSSFRHSRIIYSTKALAEFNNIKTSKVTKRKNKINPFTGLGTELLEFTLFDKENISKKIYIPEKQKKENDPDFVPVEILTNIESVSLSFKEYELVSFQCSLSSIQRHDNSCI